MDPGELVGDDLVESVVQPRRREHDWNFGFVIDGFPRNERRAECFLKSFDIDGVINLDMPDTEVELRELSRRLRSQCELDDNLIAHRPDPEDICQVCGGRLVSRPDDHPEALAQRTRDYRAQTQPVIEIFQRKVFVFTVDATRQVVRAA